MGIPWEAGEQDWRVRQGIEPGLSSQPPREIYHRYRCMSCMHEFTVGAAAAVGMVACPKCGSMNVQSLD